METNEQGLTRGAKAWLVAYGLIAVVQVVAEGLGFTELAFVLVVLAMPALAGVLVCSASTRTRLCRLVLLGLGFSWLGDWLGDIIEPHIVVKIIFFFVAHVCYIAAFWPMRARSVLRRPLVVVGYVVIIAALLVWITPYTGRLAPAMIIYGCQLALMAVLATGVHPLAGIGGALFVISDLSIAVLSFVVPGQVAYPGVIIMSTYLLAQLLIVLGVIKVLRPLPSTADTAGVGAIAIHPSRYPE